MMKPSLSVAACGLAWLLAASAAAFEAPPLTPEEATAAAADYQRYCALCHGEDRQGYANDYAPSLRSKSLLRSGFPEHILFTIAYGRRGTPMGGYFDEIGGPMDNPRIYRLTRWLKEQVPQDVDESVPGEATITIHAFEMGWLLKRVLSFGPDAEVVDPPEVRKALHDHVVAMAERARQTPAGI